MTVENCLIGEMPSRTDAQPLAQHLIQNEMNCYSGKRLENVTIFGSYNRQSIGDKAILVALLDLLFKDPNPPARVRVLAFDSQAICEELQNHWWFPHTEVRELLRPKRQTPEGATSTATTFNYRRSWKSSLPSFFKTWASMFTFYLNLTQGLASESDGLILGGGNLLMDFYTNWPIKPYLVSRQFHQVNLPVILLGIGALPIRTKLGAQLLKRISKKADLLYVRDRHTQKYLKRQWNVEATWHPDLALSFPLRQERRFASDRFLVAVNVGTIFKPSSSSPDEPGIRNLVSVLSASLSELFHRLDRNTRFFLYDTNYPTDRIGTVLLRDFLISKGVPPKCITYEDRLWSAGDIVDNLQQASLAITTRLHAALLSARAGTPTVAVAYQPKVKHVLEDIGLSKSVVEMPNLAHDLPKHVLAAVQEPQSYSLPPDRIDELDRMNRRVVTDVLQHLARQKDARTYRGTRPFSND